MNKFIYFAVTISIIFFQSGICMEEYPLNKVQQKTYDTISTDESFSTDEPFQDVQLDDNNNEFRDMMRNYEDSGCSKNCWGLFCFPCFVCAMENCGCSEDGRVCSHVIWKSCCIICHNIWFNDCSDSF